MSWAGRVALLFLLSVGSDPARTLSNAHGGKDAFYRLRDVEFHLLVTDPATGKTTDWLERYLFDGERSYGSYEENGVRTEESFDGKRVRLRVGGKETTDSGELNKARIRRKTRYFWFTLPFKLEDRGAHIRDAGPVSWEADRWNRFNLVFDRGVGDRADRLTLFVRPARPEIGAFSFRSSGYEKAQPFVVRCSNEEVSGIRLCTKREISEAAPDGRPTGKPVEEQKLERVRFWNGFTPADF